MHACTQPRRRTHAQATALQVDVYVEAAVYDELAEHSQTDLVKVLKTRRVLLSTLEIRRFWVLNADRVLNGTRVLPMGPIFLGSCFRSGRSVADWPCRAFSTALSFVIFLFRSPYRLHRCRMHWIFASRTRSRRALGRTPTVLSSALKSALPNDCS